MKPRMIVAGFLIMASACTHGRYDRDQGGPEYQNRARAYTTDPVPGAIHDPLTAPVLALVGATALGMNPSYYKSSFLGGRCVVRNSANDPLGAPCGNIVLTLRDEKTGKEIARRACEPDGHFSFAVEKDTKYLLDVASERYALAARDQGPFLQGQELLLTLEPRSKP